jgi:hypothetical protein
MVVMRRWLSLSKPPPPLDRRIVYFGEQTAIRSAILRRRARQAGAASADEACLKNEFEKFGGIKSCAQPPHDEIQQAIKGWDLQIVLK